MNKKLIPLAIIAVAFSCSYENIEDLAEVAQCGDESLSSDVIPIMDVNCTFSGCHLNSSSIPDFSDPEVIIQNATRIKARVVSRTMPPASSGLTLTQDEISTISCWVDSGAPNN